MDRKELIRPYKNTRRPIGVFRIRNKVDHFEPLDTLSPREQPEWNPSEDLRELELLWLEKLRPFGAGGYNPEPKGK